MSVLPCLYRRLSADALACYDPNTDRYSVVSAASVGKLVLARPLPNRVRMSLNGQPDIESLQRYEDALNGNLPPDAEDDFDDDDDDGDEFEDDWEDEIADNDPQFSYNPHTGRITL